MEWLDSLQTSIAKGVEEVTNIDMNQLLDLDSMVAQHSLNTEVTEIESQEQFETLVSEIQIRYCIHYCSCRLLGSASCFSVSSDPN